MHDLSKAERRAVAGSSERIAVSLAVFLIEMFDPFGVFDCLQQMPQIPGRSGSAFNVLPALKIRVEHEGRSFAPA
jgi:hypothetical protein